MGQISMEISRPNGSLLSGNQHAADLGVKTRQSSSARVSSVNRVTRVLTLQAILDRCQLGSDTLNFTIGGRISTWTVYAVVRRLSGYSTGLREPWDISMGFSLYLRMLGQACELQNRDWAFATGSTLLKIRWGPEWSIVNGRMPDHEWFSVGDGHLLVSDGTRVQFCRPRASDCCFVPLGEAQATVAMESGATRLPFAPSQALGAEVELPSDAAHPAVARSERTVD